MSIKRILSLALSLAILCAVCAFSLNAVSAEEDTQPTETKIIVHFKSEDTAPYVYYWNSLPQNIECEYPGVAMEKDSSQGDDWYTFTFDDVTKINLLFTDRYGKQLSSELTRNTGEWWYKNRIWRSSNPDNQEVSDSIDFREDTIYFVIPTRFYDGDSSNNVHCWDDGKAGNPDSDVAWRGDFKGLAEKLDYIKALGFSAIWITPVVENASGYDYHGYHAMNFDKVDPRYESSDFTYQDLIDAAHAKGMKIVQDVVWNHTGNFGETNLCNEFEKDYTKDLGNLKESMIPTKELLEMAGVKTAAEYWSLPDQTQYAARLNLMKDTTYPGDLGNSKGSKPDKTDYTMDKVSKAGNKKNPYNYWHSGYFQSLNWDDWTCKYCQIEGDCVDLNTETPDVASYTVDAYSRYIKMGVDAFRVDTVRHIPRVSLNLMYNPQIFAAAEDAGNPNFYMYGEICTRYTQVWYRDHAEESSPFYTWKERNSKWANQWEWDSSPESVNANMNITFDHYLEEDGTSNQPTSDNAFLKGLKYHEPDHSKASGMNAIDFQMHRLFGSAKSAFGIGKSGDKYYNDSSYSVMYVDSHDYAPEQPNEKTRFEGGEQTWAENLDLIFTFRGIPCVYYGSEVQFKKGEKIDVGPNAPLEETGRAYYGDYLEGDVSATDFSKFTATGDIADTLEQPLCKHLSKLNAIRRAVPALQKGQYTADSSYVSGDMAFIRRYTDSEEGTDSLALVTISGAGTFKNIPNGKYIDAVTGDEKTVTNGTLSTGSVGKANMRVYVCCASGFKGIDGAIGGETDYLK